jgi:geranylgeranylglycerol-phosphate geranylgeranyltransferase
LLLCPYLITGKNGMQRMNLTAYLTLSRPVNLALGGLSVWICAAFFPRLPAVETIISAMLTVMLLNAGANAINDWMDIEIDRINRPDRPLPAGKISRKSALIFTVVTFLLGNGIAATMLNLPAFLIAAVIASPLMLWYSISLKRSPLWGNLLVSFILGLAFLFSATAFGNFQIGMIPFILAFCYTFIRELVKDAEDVNGDAAVSARTFPLIAGIPATVRLLTLLLLILIVLIPLPYAMNIYGRYYLWSVLPGVFLPLLGLLLYILRFREKSHFGKISLFLKIDMFLGLLAIYLGKFE